VFDAILGPPVRNGPDVAAKLGGARFGDFSKAGGGEEAQEKPAPVAWLFVDQRAQEPLDFLIAELPRAGRLRELEIVKPALWIGFKADLHSA